MDDARLIAAEAIRKVRDQVRWKPGKDVVHLQKRQAMGHLPVKASLSDYNALIQSLVQEPEGRVFIYALREQPYVAVRGTVAASGWLAIFSPAGVMETAFPPGDIDAYLAQPGFTEIGTVEEVLG